MRLNIFSIPEAEVESLKSKLETSGMEIIKEVDQDGWHGSFYYSVHPSPGRITWAETYTDYFQGMELPKNLNYYAAFLLTKGPTCYALSYGKAHFYLRPFCDYDFGIELAKRIANEADIRQTASRRFQGKRKKDIRSFASNTMLDVESGESVDYIQAAIIASAREAFGQVGKFGASALVSPDIAPPELGQFLNQLEAKLNEPGRFSLPRTTVITDAAEIARFDELLLDELTAEIGTTDFTQNSYDLYGVDFVFSSAGSFTLSCARFPSVTLDELTIRDVKLYIRDNNIPREDVLKIKIRHEQEGRPIFTQTIKHALDYIADTERVLLTNGRWMHFNQDYLDFLDDYLRTILVEETEGEFADILVTETEFNQSAPVLAAGYQPADKNFSIFRVRSSTPVEAWDLKRGTRVYAVKFGTAQKLGYVCDQAINVLELLRNRAGVAEVPEFRSYCIWLGYRGQNRVTSISDTGSIILKQKVETWARKCRDLGVEPVIKISRRLKAGVDT